MDMNFHLKLKLETKFLHDQLELEELPKSLYNQTITKESYIRYLEILLAIHRAIESELKKFNQWDNFGIDLESYLRLELLKKDLSLFGVVNFKDNKTTLCINNFEKALGYLYVLTGSTMGGSILATKVSQVFNSTPYAYANNYFEAFKDKTKIMFFEFMKLLEMYSSRSDQEEQTNIILGAKECYLFVQEEFKNG